MSWIYCPTGCGAKRSMSIVSPDGDHVTECFNCGDPGYVIPDDRAPSDTDIKVGTIPAVDIANPVSEPTADRPPALRVKIMPDDIPLLLGSNVMNKYGELIEVYSVRTFRDWSFRLYDADGDVINVDDTRDLDLYA